MKIPVVALGIGLAIGVSGQHRFSWQESCFNKPWLPYCAGHDFAIRHGKAAKDKTPARVSGAGPYVATASEEDDAAPSVITVSRLNWRFADPQADALASVSFSRLAATPLALTLMAGLGANQGLSGAEIGKVFDAFSNVDQVALSIRGDRVLIMATGCPSDSIPALEAGWKTATVHDAILVGLSDDVDRALQRIAADGPLPELAGLARQQQANGNFWAAGKGSGVAADPNPEIIRFSVKASMRDRLNSDIAFEFSQPPDANTMLPAFGATSLAGNIVHVKMSMETDEVEQSLSEIAGTPLGRYLGMLVKAGRYLPSGDSGKAHPKPVIRGLNDEPK